MKIRAFYSVIVMQLFSSVVSGYGERADSIPVWQERAVLVLTNACRMAPLEFRNRYIGNNTILLSENYPAVPPLYWNRELNASSRFHCVEMGLVCGMAHDCNGVTFSERVKGFYTKSGTIGENIASGYQTPQQVVNAWIIDGQSAAEAAPDGNGDGHRANIMSSSYKEIGCGYYLSGSGRTAKTFWCQDFGGGKSPFSYHPVSAASHLFFTKTEITFFVNLYDTAQAVSELSLLLDEERYPLELTMGSAVAGTYAITLPPAATCRHYAVEVLYKTGTVIRYPEEGTLLTVGEGSCTEDNTGSLAPAGARSFNQGKRVLVRSQKGCLIVSAGDRQRCPAQTDLLDCQGILRYRIRWDQSQGSVTATHIPPGLHLLLHCYPDGSIETNRIILYR